MGFFTNYRKYSYQFSSDEIKILKRILEMVQDNLPFPRPASETIDEVLLKWSPAMYAYDDATYGMWEYLHPKTILARPEKNHVSAERIEMQYSIIEDKNISDAVESAKSSKMWVEVMMPFLPLDCERTEFALYLLENNGHMTTTILHELWHRQQFIDKPLWYIVSCTVTSLVDYEWACKQKWSIEHDVREKVDNDELKKKLNDIYVPFYSYLVALNKVNSGIEDDKKEQYYSIIEKMPQYIKDFTEDFLK